MPKIAPAILDAAQQIRDTRYPGCRTLLLAGSHVRGEATTTSDLDLVVIYDSLPNAHRDSFRFGAWPVEAFVHDPETLDHFFREVDRPSGIPSLPSMVAEGIEVPGPSPFGKQMNTLANAVLDAGPSPWTREDQDNSRYAISDLIEDLKAPRSRHETIAALTLLYPALANHIFHSRNL